MRQAYDYWQDQPDSYSTTAAEAAPSPFPKLGQARTVPGSVMRLQQPRSVVRQRCPDLPSRHRTIHGLNRTRPGSCAWDSARLTLRQGKAGIRYAPSRYGSNGRRMPCFYTQIAHLDERRPPQNSRVSKSGELHRPTSFLGTEARRTAYQKLESLGPGSH